MKNGESRDAIFDSLKDRPAVDLKIVDNLLRNAPDLKLLNENKILKVAYVGLCISVTLNLASSAFIFFYMTIYEQVSGLSIFLFALYSLHFIPILWGVLCKKKIGFLLCVLPFLYGIINMRSGKTIIENFWVLSDGLIIFALSIYVAARIYSGSNKSFVGQASKGAQV